MESILNTEKGTCYLCGCNQGREKHHTWHGTANRKIADKEGLWVWLCNSCHRELHDHGTNDERLMQESQTEWENKYIESYPYKNHSREAAREAFRQLFGKSCI